MTPTPLNDLGIKNLPANTVRIERCPQIDNVVANQRQRLRHTGHQRLVEEELRIRQR